MENQTSFAQAECAGKKKQTRCNRLLIAAASLSIMLGGSLSAQSLGTALVADARKPVD